MEKGKDEDHEQVSFRKTSTVSISTVAANRKFGTVRGIHDQNLHKNCSIDWIQQQKESL